MSEVDVVVHIHRKTCEQCLREFGRTVYSGGGIESVAEFSKRRFCSKKCNGERRRLPDGPKLGGLPHRGRKVARRKLKREKCNRCGSENRLEIHHIDRDATNNHDSNLEVLCLWCHRDEHKSVGCSVAGCDGEFLCLGFCSKHYQRYKKYGDPLVKQFNRHWAPQKVGV